MILTKMGEFIIPLKYAYSIDILAQSLDLYLVGLAEKVNSLVIFN